MSGCGSSTRIKLKDALANISAQERNARVVKDCNALVDYIRQHPKCTREDMADACGLDKHTLNNRITILQKRGILAIEKKYVISGKIE